MSELLVLKCEIYRWKLKIIKIATGVWFIVYIVFLLSKITTLTWNSAQAQMKLGPATRYTPPVSAAFTVDFL